MPTLKDSRFPPPQSWEDFEGLCADLFRYVWNDPGTQRNGRTGQPQHGVDVFGRPDGRPHYAGVQARNKIHPPTTVAVAELRDEVRKAKQFVPALKTFILATTAPNDAVIQEEARRLTEANEAEGLFSVEVWGWDELERRMTEHPEVLQQHYPQFAVGHSVEVDSVAELVRLMQERSKWTDEKDRPTFERTDGAVSSLAPQFQPSWRIRQASGDHVSNLEWRFCGPRFDMEWRAADGSRLKDTSISDVFDLTKNEPVDHPYVAVDEIGLEIRFPWRGKMRYELHRWPLSSRELPKGVLWDVGREVLPVRRFDEDFRSEDAG
ncbi:MAG: hypothetical protein HY875_16270 [Chloroflexi bacterium]|nr:hypothetical protein [Chloroflexota bacterium]